MGDAQVPAVQVGLHGELIRAEHDDVHVLVGASGGADEQVDRVTASDPPTNREAISTMATSSMDNGCHGSLMAMRQYGARHLDKT